MKALTVWQPWASLIADGHKHFETRSWQTEYRGGLLICSAKHRMSFVNRADIADFQGWPEHLRGYLLDNSSRLAYNPGYDKLPFGKALCIVEVVGCWNTSQIIAEAEAWGGQDRFKKELLLGDYRHGRFGLKLVSPRCFIEPWPVRGQQGLFNVPDEEVAKHELEET